VQHGEVLDGRNNDVLTFALLRQGQPFDGKVVALRATSGKDDLLRAGADEIIQEGLPKNSSRKGSIASLTSGIMGVVDTLSR
jgi:hypothetical protein